MLKKSLTLCLFSYCVPLLLLLPYCMHGTATYRYVIITFLYNEEAHFLVHSHKLHVKALILLPWGAVL